MTGPALLAAVGVMLILTGLLVALAAALGVRLGQTRPGSGRARLRSRIRVSRRWLVAVLVGVVTLLITGWVAVALAAGAAVLGVPIVVGKGAAEAQIARLEALTVWTRRLADLLASGAARSLDEAIRRSAPVAPPLIATQIGALLTRMRAWGTGPALLALARDLADQPADEVVLALLSHQEHGGQGLAEVLTALATDLDATIRARRDIEAERAAPRNTARNLLLLTAAVMLGLSVFFRAFLTPYHTVTGQLLLVLIMAVFAAALAWMWIIIRPPAGARLLVEADFEQAGIS